MPALHNFRKLRLIAVKCKYLLYTKLWGMDIDPTVRFSMSAKMDLTYPKGIHIGPHTYIAFRTSILTHDMTRGLFTDTRIGRNCFIGAHVLIMPGVRVGDGSIVAAGSIVTKNVPPGCIVAGNPARIIRENIKVKAYGRLLDADENERAFKEWLVAKPMTSSASQSSAGRYKAGGS